jgi:hypothetical protein
VWHVVELTAAEERVTNVREELAFIVGVRINKEREKDITHSRKADRIGTGCAEGWRSEGDCQARREDAGDNKATRGGGNTAGSDLRGECTGRGDLRRECTGRGDLRGSHKAQGGDLCGSYSTAFDSRSSILNEISAIFLGCSPMALTTAAALTKRDAERTEAATIMFRKDFMIGARGGILQKMRRWKGAM